MTSTTVRPPAVPARALPRAGAPWPARRWRSAAWWRSIPRTGTSRCARSTPPPGCNARSAVRCGRVYNLAHGRVGSALHDNLLFVLAVPVVAYLWWDGQRRRRQGRPERHGSRFATVAVIALLVVFTVVRNLPFGSWLRPA